VLPTKKHLKVSFWTKYLGNQGELERTEST